MSKYEMFFDLVSSLGYWANETEDGSVAQTAVLEAENAALIVLDATPREWRTFDARRAGEELLDDVRDLGWA